MTTPAQSQPPVGSGGAKAGAATVGGNEEHKTNTAPPGGVGVRSSGGAEASGSPGATTGVGANGHPGAAEEGASPSSAGETHQPASDASSGGAGKVRPGEDVVAGTASGGSASGSSGADGDGGKGKWAASVAMDVADNGKDDEVVVEQSPVVADKMVRPSRWKACVMQEEGVGVAFWKCFHDFCGTTAYLSVARSRQGFKGKSFLTKINEVPFMSERYTPPGAKTFAWLGRLPITRVPQTYAEKRMRGIGTFRFFFLVGCFYCCLCDLACPCGAGMKCSRAAVGLPPGFILGTCRLLSCGPGNTSQIKQRLGAMKFPVLSSSRGSGINSVFVAITDRDRNTSTPSM